MRSVLPDPLLPTAVQRLTGRSWTARLEASAVAILLLLAMLDLPNYVNVLSDSLPPKLLYIPMLVSGVVVLLLSSNVALARVGPLLVAFVVIYTVVNAGHGLQLAADGNDEGAHIAWSRLQFLVLAFGLAMATTVVSRTHLSRIFAACSMLIAVSIVLDSAVPYFLYPASTPGIVPGRSGSFFINPNKAGEAVVLTALLALPALSRRTALPLLGLAAMAVILTFSRSAMVAIMLLCALAFASGLLTRMQVLVALAAVLAVVAGDGVLAFLTSTNYLPSVNAEDIAGRLQFLATGNLRDASVDERMFVLLKGLELFRQNIVLGAGAGATHLWEFAVAPHNQAVLMAAEYGVAGLVAWGCIIWLVGKGRYFGNGLQQAGAAMLVLFFSMATHNMLDFPYWSIAIMVLSMNLGPRHSPSIIAPRPAPRPPKSILRIA